MATPAVPFLVIFVLLAIYYVVRWHSLENLVVALDHDPQVFLDYVANYYPQAAAILHSSNPVAGYFYSAFFALLLLPLTLLGPGSSLWAWAAIQVGTAAGLCALPLARMVRLRGIWAAVYVGVFATSLPVLHTLRWGQVSILLTLLVIGSFHAHDRGHRVLAGVLIAVAAAIKLYPALFILYFVFKRDWRVCWSFALAFVVAYALIPAAVLGPRAWSAFEISATGAIAKADWVATDVNSQYLPHVVARWARIASGSGQPLGEAAIKAVTLGGYLLFLANAAFVWLLQHRKARPVYALTLLFLSIPLIVSTSWPHYFAFLPFCQVVVLRSLLDDRASTRGLRLTLWTLFAIATACSSIFLFDAFGSWADYSGFGLLLVADLLLMGLVYTMSLPRLLRRPI